VPPRLQAIVLLLATTLSSQGVRVSDAAAASPPSREGGSVDPLAEASALYAEGTVAYEAADYTGAIAKFTQALGIVVETRANDEIRLRLLYNIATAHEKAYAIDQDVVHLRQAKELYLKYRDFAKEHGDLGDELDVESRILGVERQLQALSGQGAATEKEATPTPRQGRDKALEPKPRPDGRDRRSLHPLVLGGGVGLGLGAVGLGVMGAGLAMGNKAQQDFESALGPDDEGLRVGFVEDGERANTIAIAGGVAGGVFVITGAVLVALGVKRGAGRGQQASITPTIGRESAMLVLQGRF